MSIVSFIRTSPIRNPNNTSAKKEQIKEQKFGAIGNSDDGKIRLLFDSLESKLEAFCVIAKVFAPDFLYIITASHVLDVIPELLRAITNVFSISLLSDNNE